MNGFIIGGIILVLLGIGGSLLPALPGPVLSFAGLLLLFLGKTGVGISNEALIWFGGGMVLLVVVDYLMPILGAKFSGATTMGIWGAVIGGLGGILFFPPWGIFIGSFFGAVLGEIIAGRKLMAGLKAGAGVLLGNVTVIILQVIYSVTLAIYFFVKLI